MTPRSSLIKLLALIVVGVLICTACNSQADVLETATPTVPLIITATLPATQTQRPSPTLEPATATVVVAPSEGQTTSQLNVRKAPSATSEQLGTINIFAKIQIVGKDPSGGWWMILYPESPNGTGWVTAQFVQVPDSSNVPVINAEPEVNEGVPPESIPATGEANPPGAPGSGSIPSPVPTSALATAFPDGDSVQNPAINITLSAVSTRSFTYSSDISTPEGDAEDWVQFSLDGQPGQQITVDVMLDCTGSSNVSLELIQNNVVLQGWDQIACGQRSQLQLFLFAGAPYALRLSPEVGNSAINYVAYTVTVQLTI